jgi:hypothetical protein
MLCDAGDTWEDLPDKPVITSQADLDALWWADLKQKVKMEDE